MLVVVLADTHIPRRAKGLPEGLVSRLESADLILHAGDLLVEDVTVAMIHDSGPKKGRWGRMRRRFPGARIVVFGHSHIPWIEDEGGLMLLNPGSPTDRRRAPDHTFALLRVEGGEARAEILTL